MADRNELPAGMVSAEEARALRIDDRNSRWVVERRDSEDLGPVYEINTEAEEGVALVVDIDDPRDLAEATLCAAAPVLRDTVEHLWAEVARLRGDLEAERAELERREARVPAAADVILAAHHRAERAEAEVARLQALLTASPLRVAPSEHDGSAA